MLCYADACHEQQSNNFEILQVGLILVVENEINEPISKHINRKFSLLEECYSIHEDD